MYARIGEAKRELYQWDTGQFLEVSEDVARVDFCYREKAKMVYGVFSKDGRVIIPDVMLQQSGVMDALIMGSSGGSHTVQRMEITVIERPIPPGYVVSPQGGIFSYDDLYLMLEEMGAATTGGFKMLGDIDMNDYRVTNLDEPEMDGDAVPKKWAEDNFLTIKGGTLTGRLNGLKDPIKDDEAAPKSYVDKRMPIEGGTFTGNVDMGGKKLHNLPTPNAGDDAVTKQYVDGKHIGPIYATIGITWNGAEAPYTQEVSIPGIMESDNPHVTPDYSDNNDTAIAQREAWGMVCEGKASNGKITFICLEDKPTTAVPIMIEVNR